MLQMIVELFLITRVLTVENRSKIWQPLCGVYERVEIVYFGIKLLIVDGRVFYAWISWDHSIREYFVS